MLKCIIKLQWTLLHKATPLHYTSCYPAHHCDTDDRIRETGTALRTLTTHCLLLHKLYITQHYTTPYSTPAKLTYIKNVSQLSRGKNRHCTHRKARHMKCGCSAAKYKMHTLYHDIIQLPLYPVYPLGEWFPGNAHHLECRNMTATQAAE